MKKLAGNIPENIVYICKGGHEITPKFDDLEESFTTQMVTPAFVSDATNAKTIESGKTWALGWSNTQKIDFEEITEQEYDSIEFRNNKTKYSWKKTEYDFEEEKFKFYGIISTTIDSVEPTIVKKKNEPIKGIRIVNLEHRGNGGRAYKVVVDGYYFDLREDVLLEILLNCEIKEGVINAQFIWARVHAEMKLIRIGSALHTAMVAATQLFNKTKLSVKDLQVGGVYETKSSRFLFLGYYDTEIYEECNRKHTSSIFYKVHLINNQLWIEIDSWSLKQIFEPSLTKYNVNHYDAMIKSLKDYNYNLRFRKTMPPILTKTHQIDLENRNILNDIRELGNTLINKALIKNAAERKIKGGHNITSEFGCCYFYANLANISLVGDSIKLHHFFDKPIYNNQEFKINFYE